MISVRDGPRTRVDTYDRTRLMDRDKVQDREVTRRESTRLQAKELRNEVGARLYM